MKYVFILIAGLFIAPCFSQAKQKVKVAQGYIEGVQEKSGVYSYKGIPFAQPPVGELRWKAPQPPKKWNGVLKATEFGNSPMQKNVYGDMNFRAPKMSEDCLYLNVWTPAKKADEKLPVLVYFYGGGFVAGDGSEYRYDGESLAEKGIVTVTLNYRLGIFGFFSHPELTKESANNSSGNYGLLDQHAALVWVKKNIAAFGGDPDKITIAGESAGSISVSAQMASPLSKDLIAGAIGQSGAMIYPTFPAIPLAEAEKNGIIFMEKSQNNSLAELRKLSAEELLDKASMPGTFTARGVVDGYFLPKDPLEIYKAGEQAKVPLLAGWTSAEMPYMVFMKGEYPNPENYKKRIQEEFDDSAEKALKLFPGTTEEEVIASASALASANFIVFSAWKWADTHIATTNQPTYVYKFSKQRPPMKAEMGNAKQGLAGGIIKDDGKKEPEENKMPAGIPGAAHASDIEYALGNLATNHVYEWTEEDYAVSDLTERYFENFIKTGNPNGKKLPEWTVSTTQIGIIILDINNVTKAEKDNNREQYLFLSDYFSEKSKK